MVLAPFDVRCSLAHVDAVAQGGAIDAHTAKTLKNALDAVALEIQNGTFAADARKQAAEDIHGAIDARVREIAGSAGAALHTGRSRNDQVATTLRLFAADACLGARASIAQAVRTLVEHAGDALAARAVLPAMTHWQPAQPVLLAFWLAGAAQPLVRAADRCAGAAAGSMSEMPLGSGAVCGSTLPLVREAGLAALGFAATTANAMDAVGSRDAVLECAHAIVTALVAASRIAEELVIWCNPLVGFAAVADAAATGSSLMPQKRNPDPLELVRGLAPVLAGLYAGALTSTAGLALSYHRDLQQTKAAVLQICVQGVAALAAFARTLGYVTYDRSAMSAAALRGFTVATDIADTLIHAGVPARSAHQAVGAAVAKAESQKRDLQEADVREIAAGLAIGEIKAPLTPIESVCSKRTAGSTAPDEVAKHLSLLREWLKETGA